MFGPNVAFAAWRSFGVADGMANESVRAIGEDSHGALWFGVPAGAGISRYDGATWQTFAPTIGGPVSTSVTCMLTDRSGKVWFGTTNAGVMRYDGSQWMSFADELTSRSVTCLFEDASGRLWVGTSAGINSYNGSWTRFPAGVANAPRSVTAITQDLSGRLWVGTTIDLRSWDGTAWAVYAKYQGNLFSQVPDGILALCRERGGRVWLGCVDGVAAYDPQRDPSDPAAWRIFHSSDSLVLDDVKAIVSDAKGNLWFGHSIGLSRFDGHRWRDYSAPTTYVLHFDRSGNLWLGCDAGARVYDRVSWDLFTNAQLPGVGCEDLIAPGGAGAVFQDSTGALWFATCGGGVVHHEGSAWTTFVDSLPSPRVSSIAADSAGALWIGTDRGVVRYDGVSWRTYDRGSGLICDTVRTSSQGPGGRMWVGTARGISSFDGTSWQSYGKRDGLIDEDVLNLIDDRSGNLWAGTSRGASRFDGQSWTSFPVPDPLPSAVRAIAVDRDGRLWFGTGDGLRILEGGAWRAYTIANADLADNSIHSILVDHLGLVWVGTSGGISRFDGANWIRLLDPLARLSPGSMLEDISGDLWLGIPRKAGFGATEGAVRHEPDRVPPQAVIAPRPVALSANTVQTLRFVAGYKETEGILFSHSFDGEPFSGWAPESFWVAKGLGNGVHTFLVKARDPLLQEDPTPDTVSFEVDAAAPAPAFSSPVFGEPVRDSVAIVGSVDDLRFRSYRVLVRREGAMSWSSTDATQLAADSVAIQGGVLAEWNTRSYPDGNYELKAEVTDTLGLVGSTTIVVQVDNVAPWAIQTSPAKVSAALGGDVYTLHREVHLYVPPHAFAEDAIVTIDSLPAGQLPDSLPNGARPRAPGYAISWGGVPLAKAAIVDLRLEPQPVRPVSLWRRVATGSWSPVGGTTSDGLLSATLSQPGSYVVFEGAATPPVGGGVSSLSLTPRVFSRSRLAGGELGIGFVLGRAGPVSVAIYDRAGREVRELAHDAEMPAGANLLRWDGRGRDGDAVEDGLYLVAVSAHGERKTQALAVLR